MRNTHEEISTTRRLVVDSIICDKCGVECLTPGGQHHRSGTEFFGSFGYGSEFDTEDWQFDLCDDCCRWLSGQLQRVGVQNW